MPPRDDSAVYKAVLESLRGVKEAIASLHSDLHELALLQARESTEQHARLRHVEAETRECREQRVSGGAAKVAGKTAINVQLIATIGAVLTSIGALVAVLLK